MVFRVYAVYQAIQVSQDVIVIAFDNLWIVGPNGLPGQAGLQGQKGERGQ